MRSSNSNSDFNRFPILRLGVLISGSGSNLEAIINSCNSNVIYGKVISVISNNPEAYGITRAKESNIDVKIINHKDFLKRIDFDNELEKNLEDLNPDLIVSSKTGTGTAINLSSGLFEFLEASDGMIVCF